MANAKRIVMAAVRAAAREAVADQLEELEMPCEMPRCNHYSAGIRCGCGRLICNKHMYVKLNDQTLKPETMCPSCIVDNHPELFE